MELTPGEEAVKTVEMATKDVEYDINLADKAAARSERTDSNSERSSIGKTLSSSIAGCREIIQERKSQSVQQTSLLSCWKKWSQAPQPSATSTMVSELHQQNR